MNMKKIKGWLGNNLWFFPVLLGTLLRLYKLTYSSIWHDEGYTVWLINNNFGDIIARTARDVHPPGYYLISKPWVTIFGSSVFSIRFFSLLFSVGIIFFLYKIVREIWSKEAAFWASLFVSFSPFMIRFGQEARMYGVVAFFTTLATYYFVKYIKEKKAVYLWLYVPAMIVAMYTQYYSFFVLVSHWVILSIYTEGFWGLKWKKGWKKPGVLDPWWWVSTVSLILLYLPWFPVAYKQVTRVSDSYWIKPEWITALTIPNNIFQFIGYAHLDKVNSLAFVGPVLFWLIVALFVAPGIYLLKLKKKAALGILVYGYLPMILVFVLSKLRTPVYQDRYFPFSAVALFALWGIFISVIKNKKVRLAIGGIFIGLLLIGNCVMHIEVNHQMRQVAEIIEIQKEAGDMVISGELYTFLDGSYYLGYKKIKFLSKPVDGYGESSLFYDQQKDYLVTKEEVQKYPRVWVLGKTGEKDYFSEEFWQGWDSITYFRETKDNGLKLVLYIKR